MGPISGAIVLLGFGVLTFLFSQKQLQDYSDQECQYQFGDLGDADGLYCRPTHYSQYSHPPQTYRRRRYRPRFRQRQHYPPTYYDESSPADLRESCICGDGLALSRNDDSPCDCDGKPRVWFSALGAAVFISVIPVMLLYFIPEEDSGSPLLKTGLAFAAGCLLGDAFLHMIPHALYSKSGKDDAAAHGHSHGAEQIDYITVCLKLFVVMCSFYLFFALDRFIRLGMGGHGHSHSLHSLAASGGGDSPPGGNARPGYLNIIADLLHSFMDGVFIGASFLTDETVGIVTMFTVLCHEVPHAIGDFAIFIQSGMTKSEAIALQLKTTLGGVVAGTLVSLIVLGNGLVYLATAWIMPFAAGSFIYIASCTIIPELSKSGSWFQILLELTAMMLGLVLMLIIAFLE